MTITIPTPHYGDNHKQEHSDGHRREKENGSAPLGEQAQRQKHKTERRDKSGFRALA
jgi:hypothetical protein